MNPFTLVKIAIRALLRNRMRTFLSVLGIVIGVAAVITMVAMGEGSKKSIKEQMTAMGTNAITIMPNQSRRGGVQSESSEMLEEEDVIELREKATYIDGVSPMVSVGGQAIVGNNNSPTTLSGVSADYLKIRNYEIAEGVMFDDEADRMAKVCVIGQTVVKNLFAGENPIGKTIAFVTHEPDIATFSSRTITLRDGLVKKDVINEKVDDAEKKMRDTLLSMLQAYTEDNNVRKRRRHSASDRNSGLRNYTFLLRSNPDKGRR